MTTSTQQRADRPAARAAQLPPGPQLPAAIQSLLFLLAPYATVPRWHRRYGDVFSVNLTPAGRAVVLANPDHIREVFTGAPNVFHAGEGNAILRSVMGENSVLLLDEEAHQVARKRVMAAFHGETMRGWGERIEQITDAELDRWPLDRPFSVHASMNAISLEVIMRIVFGLSDDAGLDRLRPLLTRLVQVGPMVLVGWMYPPLQRLGPWRRFMRLRDRVDELLHAEIVQRRASIASDGLAGRVDVLSKLLDAAPEQTDEELRDHLVTLLLAGHETTASTLAWTMHELARAPQVQARAQQAAEDDASDGAGYLDATLKESMRLHPVIRSVARYLNEPAHVAGYDLPAGVTLFPSIMLVHHTPSLWPSPEAFRPERFIGANPSSTTWFPFGGGIRRCLGAGLATVEGQAVLTTVLRRFDIAADGEREHPTTRNITTVPSRGARVVVTPRAGRAG
jgi:cytochrome P450